MENKKGKSDTAKQEAEVAKKSSYDGRNRMLTMPVQKLIISLGIPTTISMLVTTVYNLADTYFVGRLGTSASGAIGIVFTLMGVLQAIGFMTGQGAGSNISRLLGAKKIKQASLYASVGFFAGLFFGVIAEVLGLLFLTPLMRVLGSTETILPFSSEYAFYILIAAPFMVGSCVLNNILRFEGRAAFAMVGLASGGILNIIGDAICIMGLHTGIAGAGISTAISQFIGFCILLSMFLRNKTQSKISFGICRDYFFGRRELQNAKNSTASVNKANNEFSKNNLDKSGENGYSKDDSSIKSGVLASIILIGLPSLARQGLGSVSTMLLNQSCAVYGDAAIAAMSIVSRISFFIFAVGLGVGQGFQPVCGFNYGAKKYDRVKKGFYFTLSFGTALLGCFALVALAFSGSLVHIFRDDPRVVEIGTVALRYQCIALFFVPTCVCGNMLFQSVGKSGRAFLLSCLRSGCFFIPLIVILPRVMGLLGIQIAQPIADFMAAAASLPFSISFLRKITGNN